MRKTKGFMIGAIFFYIWYVYTGAVYEFAYFTTSGMLYKVLLVTAPLVWIDMEFAASVLGIIAPILFLAVTVIIDLLPAFTKAQKIVLTVLPIVSYTLLLIMECIANTYFRYGAFH